MYEADGKLWEASVILLQTATMRAQGVDSTDGIIGWLQRAQKILLTLRDEATDHKWRLKVSVLAVIVSIKFNLAGIDGIPFMFESIDIFTYVSSLHADVGTPL